MLFLEKFKQEVLNMTHVTLIQERLIVIKSRDWRFISRLRKWRSRPFSSFRQGVWANDAYPQT